MPKEGEPIPLSAIHIDLQDRSISFQSQDQLVAKLHLGPEGLLLEVLRQASVAEGQAQPASPPAEAQPIKEAAKTVTLTGRLKTEPKQGKPDSRGNPTAFARLAVHEEGREDAHLYLASFHRHTTAIALTLAKDAQVTVEGYPHQRQDPSGNRMDTFSVINLVNYPGKSKD